MSKKISRLTKEVSNLGKYLILNIRNVHLDHIAKIPSFYPLKKSPYFQTLLRNVWNADSFSPGKLMTSLPSKYQKLAEAGGLKINMGILVLNNLFNHNFLFYSLRRRWVFEDDRFIYFKITIRTGNRCYIRIGYGRVKLSRCSGKLFQGSFRVK